jgi:hypothetical protein
LNFKVVFDFIVLMILTKEFIGIVLVQFLALIHLSVAQNREFKSFQKQYPEEAAVITKHRQVITVDIENDSLHILVEKTEEVLHLNQQSKALIEDKVFIYHFNELIDIQAKTMVPDGKNYREVWVEDYKEKYEQGSGVFYDDTRSLSFFYPQVAAGVKTYQKTVIRIIKPEFFPGFYFGSFLPVHYAELVLRIDPRVDIDFKMFNTESLEVEQEEYTADSYQVIKWTAEQLPALKFENDAPQLAYYAPHIIFKINSFSVKNRTVRVMEDLDDLYRLYRSFTSHLDDQPTQLLISLADSLTRNATTDREKAEKIFAWVQSNINYVAFEDGLRGFVPHPAQVTLENRYGDCKDMACLTQRLLQTAGLDAKIAWIGTRKLPYRYDEVPTPAADNHMITILNTDSSRLFLDATGKYTAFGMPTSMLQGKEALIGLGDKRYEIEEVPVISPTMNVRTDSTIITIQDRNLVGYGFFEATGYERSRLTYRLTERTEEDQLKVVTRLLQKGNNTFAIDSFSLENLESLQDPLRIEYQFRIKDYLSRAGNEIYLNLHLHKLLDNQFLIPESRKLPREFDHLYLKRDIVVLQLDGNLEWSDLPENEELVNELVDISIQYLKRNNQLVVIKEVRLKTLSLQPEDFAAWNQLITDLNEVYRNLVTLRNS